MRVGSERSGAGEGRVAKLLLSFLTKACLFAFIEKEINRQGETPDLENNFHLFQLEQHFPLRLLSWLLNV